MPLNVCVGSYRFSYILSLRMDRMNCNSINELFVLLSIWSVLSVPPPGSSVQLTVLVQWAFHSTGISKNIMGSCLITCI